MRKDKRSAVGQVSPPVRSPPVSYPPVKGVVTVVSVGALCVVDRSCLSVKEGDRELREKRVLSFFNFLKMLINHET